MENKIISEGKTDPIRYPFLYDKDIVAYLNTKRHCIEFLNINKVNEPYYLFEAAVPTDLALP